MAFVVGLSVDDPQVLTQINSVFVTVESSKKTSRLYSFVLIGSRLGKWFPDFEAQTPGESDLGRLKQTSFVMHNSGHLTRGIQSSGTPVHPTERGHPHLAVSDLETC